MTDHRPEETDEDRRKFLASCGKFAAITPPAITMLLSTSLNSDAIAKSGGGGGYGGGGGSSKGGGNGHNHNGNNGNGSGGGWSGPQNARRD